MLSGGVALADHHRGGRERDRRGPVYRDDRRDDRRWERRTWPRREHRSYRQPVYVNNGRFTFHNGVSYNYVRPTFRHRYYDVRYRPPVIVENYQPVAGYSWVGGQWQWNGYEWQWVSGHYGCDPSAEPTYDEPTYDPDRGNYYPQY